MNSITLHPEHGLNPTMGQCIICGKETGEIALLGASYKGEAPRSLVVSFEPCTPCREKYLSEGTLLVEMHETYKGRRYQQKPQREPTGHVVVLKDDAFERLFDQPTPPQKIALVEQGLLEQLGITNPNQRV